MKERLEQMRAEDREGRNEREEKWIMKCSGGKEGSKEKTRYEARTQV